MNTRKLSYLSVILLTNVLLLAEFKPTAWAELIIGISFPSQDSNNKGLDFEETEFLVLPRSSTNQVSNIPPLPGSWRFIGTNEAGFLYSRTFTNSLMSKTVPITRHDFNSQSSTNNAPVLNLTASKTALQLDWPVARIGWVLQTRSGALDIESSSQWEAVTGSSATNHVELPLNGNASSVFFRLVPP